MERYSYTVQTKRIFKDVFQKYGEAVGIVIQAYLHRTADDIQELAELGADVRLCKGAYKEPADIALRSEERRVGKEYGCRCAPELSNNREIRYRRNYIHRRYLIVGI